MSLSNPSQVLLRNSELLTSATPLLINLPEDGFIDELITLNESAKVSCYNTNFIDHQALTHKHGSRIHNNFTCVYESELQHDLVIIAFPKSKAELNFTLAMIAPFLTAETKILIVGEKKGGIQSTPKLTANFLEHCQKVDSARHCFLFAGLMNENKRSVPFKLESWYKHYAITVDGIELAIASLPGVFSQEKLDIGTALLLSNLPKELTGKILDFGCGAGVISCFIAKKYSNVELSLLDVSALALASAEKTLALNNINATVFPSNSLSEVTNTYQHIVSNPPFHQGVNTNYQATETFLSGIHKNLKKKGSITIVANSFLRYQPIMEQYIGCTSVITKAQGFTIYHASKR
ncbi:methyltransferase [Colwellia sp. D2M02]|uniref:methyltransferase n=1 Tax=Colwellia sp. D2M02 TaxID=2841562 RepID=UPI001C0998A7|nr:methyltransferase [Colwellia sp. D2M02]MBU2894179.1 methyltransferase [Colwellia sp. D2M02]